MSDTSIKIIYYRSKGGYMLKVNGLYVHALDQNQVKAIVNDYTAPYGATVWVSVAAIRVFWNKHRAEIVAATLQPYKSIWGQLVPAFKSSSTSKS